MKINKGTILIWKKEIPHYVAEGGAKAEVTKDYNGEEYIYVKWLDETKHLSFGQRDGEYYLKDFIVDDGNSILNQSQREKVELLEKVLSFYNEDGNLKGWFDKIEELKTKIERNEKYD